MREGRAYGREQRVYRFKGASAAPPEIVYDTLAELQTHLEWGGRRQWKMFGMLSIDAPSSRAELGTEFTSVGNIPMNSAHWENENKVTAAERPLLFEVTTEGRIAWSSRPPGHGTFVHRFQISPAGTGSSVTYLMRQLRFQEPPWGLRYPLMRSITANVWIPIWLGRGFRSLLRLAEERSRVEIADAIALQP